MVERTKLEIARHFPVPTKVFSQLLFARAGGLFVRDEILMRADYTVAMPWGLKRFQQASDLHFISRGAQVLCL